MLCPIMSPKRQSGSLSLLAWQVRMGFESISVCLSASNHTLSRVAFLVKNEKPVSEAPKTHDTALERTKEIVFSSTIRRVTLDWLASISGSEKETSILAPGSACVRVTVYGDGDGDGGDESLHVNVLSKTVGIRGQVPIITASTSNRGSSLVRMSCSGCDNITVPGEEEVIVHWNCEWLEKRSCSAMARNLKGTPIVIRSGKLRNVSWASAVRSTKHKRRT